MSNYLIRFIDLAKMNPQQYIDEMLTQGYEPISITDSSTIVGSNTSVHSLVILFKKIVK
jgi:hypothetical protein